MKPPSPLLQLFDLSLQKGDKRLINHVSFSVYPGEVLIISGPSGAGKSTLLRLIARFESPTSGDIQFQNRNLRHYSPEPLRRQIALVFQTPIVFSGTVQENFQLVDQINHRAIQPEPIYQQKLESVGLPHAMLFQEAASLSLGEKQRLAIARALLNQPEILLLDEPTSALDPQSSQVLLNTLKGLHQEIGITILMVTHQAPHGEAIGTRQLQLSEGTLLEDRPILEPQAGIPRE